MHPAIRIENLGKRYLVDQRTRAGYRTLRESLTNLATRPLRYLRGEPKIRREAFWALRDVNLDVHPGEVVGIVGRNGAGKSTLLKLLSQITKPTCGRVEVRGRVGSLLEVGTGFHPELTGRENIFLNGSILGMRRREIQRKFQEIVDFAEIDQFLDTPVKRYSSGMYVRLAFAVAAHLEPEILMVDEVLAVGDAAFQQRCLNRMRECATDGRTVLLVSHHMNNVRDLCRHVVWLDKGTVRQAGPTGDVLGVYLEEVAARAQPGQWVSLRNDSRSGTGAARIVAGRFYGRSPEAPPEPDGPLQVELRIESNAASAETNSRPLIEIQIVDRYRTKLMVMNTIELRQPIVIEPGVTELAFAIDALHLAPGSYTVNVCMGSMSDIYDLVSDAFVLEVASPPGGDAATGVYSLVTRTFSVQSISSEKAPAHALQESR